MREPSSRAAYVGWYVSNGLGSGVGNNEMRILRSKVNTINGDKSEPTRGELPEVGDELAVLGRVD